VSRCAPPAPDPAGDQHTVCAGGSTAEQIAISGRRFQLRLKAAVIACPGSQRRMHARAPAPWRRLPAKQLLLQVAGGTAVALRVTLTLPARGAGAPGRPAAAGGRPRRGAAGAGDGRRAGGRRRRARGHLPAARARGAPRRLGRALPGAAGAARAQPARGAGVSRRRPASAARARTGPRGARSRAAGAARGARGRLVWTLRAMHAPRSSRGLESRAPGSGTGDVSASHAGPLRAWRARVAHVRGLPVGCALTRPSLSSCS